MTAVKETVQGFTPAVLPVIIKCLDCEYQKGFQREKEKNNISKVSVHIDYSIVGRYMMAYDGICWNSILHISI